MILYQLPPWPSSATPTRALWLTGIGSGRWCGWEEIALFLLLVRIMNRKGFCSCLALDMSLLSHLLSFFSCSVSFLFFLVPNGLLLLLSPCCLFCLSISFSCLSELACASATSALISLCLCIYLHFIFHSCCAFICLLMLSRLNVLV